MTTYCDSLAAAAVTVLRRERRLPLSGEVLVKPGEIVTPETLIGYQSSEECLHFLRLEADESQVLATVLKHVGDEVRRGEPVAYYMYFFGLGYKEYVSPVRGTISSFDDRTGMMVIREHPMPIRSGLHGTVEEVIEGRGAVIACRGAWVGATAGWGGEAFGELLLMTSSPAEPLDPQRLGPQCHGKILVGGSFADKMALLTAYRFGARGVIVGGVDELAADEFASFTEGMTYEEYAARFWSGRSEPEKAEAGLDRVSMTVIATEGLGRLPMRAVAFELLRANDGRSAYLDGKGGRAWPEERPEAIVSLPASASQPGVVPEGAAMPAGDQADAAGLAGEHAAWRPLEDGCQVRIVGGPHNGRTGIVSRTGSEVLLETGRRMPGARVELADGGEAWAPLTNLEIIAPRPGTLP